MRIPLKERAFPSAIVILATVVVIILAVLQYRWSNQVSDATGIRLADSLQMSMINWHLDFFRDFSEICIALHVDQDADAPGDWNQYARRLGEWKKTTEHPELVSAAYVIQMSDPRGPNSLRLDPATLRFEPGDLPPNLASLPRELEKIAPEAVATSSDSRADQIQDPRWPLSDREFTDRFYSGSPLAGWRFDSSIPALVRPVPRRESAEAGHGNASPRGMDWIVVALDATVVRKQLLPDLAERYFRGTEGLDYQVAVISGNDPPYVLYTSDAGFGGKEVTDADGSMDIFGRLRNDGQESPLRIFHAPSENKGPAASVGITWFPLLRGNGEEQDWRLIVRHRRGGALGAFVADSRRQDLAISFGVLFLLVISIAILIVTSTRAQRLAKL
ncbi:MAG: hypothetical protein ACRD4Y_15020, partial [Candidatus Acidiferrales bacterium]